VKETGLAGVYPKLGRGWARHDQQKQCKNRDRTTHCFFEGVPVYWLSGIERCRVVLASRAKWLRVRVTVLWFNAKEIKV